MPNPTATTTNPALLPSPALFDVTTIAAKDVEGTIERIALDQLELAPNARRDISEEGIERLAAMLMRTGQLVPCIGHRAAPPPRSSSTTASAGCSPPGPATSSPAVTGSRACSRCRA